MDLTPSELGYFITQVGLAATSFGVSTEDVTAVAGALNKLFGYRCSPPTTVIPEQGATLNSICQNEECPLDAMATCAAYPQGGKVKEPQTAMPSGMPTMSMNGTATMMPTATMPGVPMFTGAAGHVSAGVGAIVGALALGLAL